MMTEVYIGRIRSEGFDYCKNGDWNGYFPEKLCDMRICHKLYFDIVGDVLDKKPDTRQTDWGCFVIKMKRDEMMEYLGRYMDVQTEKETAEYLIGVAKGLPDGEYLLVALEGVSMIED